MGISYSTETDAGPDSLILPATTVESEIERVIPSLLQMSRTDLELELGRVLSEIKTDISTSSLLRAAQPATPAPSTALDKIELRSLAGRFLSRFDRLLYALVCDPLDRDNAFIREIAKTLSPETVAATICGVLISTLGLVPGIACIVAALIAKRLLEAGYQIACENWKDALPPT